MGRLRSDAFTRLRSLLLLPPDQQNGLERKPILVLSQGGRDSRFIRLGLTMCSRLLVAGRMTEHLSVELLPVRSDAPLRFSQADPSGADQRVQPRVEPVLDHVSGGVVREGVLLREQVGNVVGAAQPERNDVIDLQRVSV